MTDDPFDAVEEVFGEGTTALVEDGIGVVRGPDGHPLLFMHPEALRQLIKDWEDPGAPSPDI